MFTGRLSHMIYMSTLGMSLAQGLNSTSSWVILQGFDWDALGNRGNLYSQLQGAASSIGEAGFNAIWFPPPSQSVDKEGYLPQEWYTLESESNQMNAVASVKSSGMSPLADVVVNHRTAPYIDSCTGKYTVFKNPDMVGVDVNVICLLT